MTERLELIRSEASTPKNGRTLSNAKALRLNDLYPQHFKNLPSFPKSASSSVAELKSILGMNKSLSSFKTPSKGFISE